LAAPYHVTPVAVRRRVVGQGILAALTWTGDAPEEATPWTLLSAQAGQWKLRHAHLGSWEINHPLLPAIPGSAASL
jgi:hypothetical protein